jgi:hypothetical protein
MRLHILLSQLAPYENTLEALFWQSDLGVFQDTLSVIDLGAGHASVAESLSGRGIAALKSQGSLSESVGGQLHRDKLASR